MLTLVDRLLDIPSSLLRFIFLSLDDKSLSNIFSISDILSDILESDEIFWLEKTKLKFPNEVDIKFKSNKLSWKRYYKSLLEYQVYTFGFYGQLEYGNINDLNIPTLIEDFDDIVQVSCGGGHTAIIDSAGQVYTFGFGDFGKLEHDDNNDRNTPIEDFDLNL